MEPYSNGCCSSRSGQNRNPLSVLRTVPDLWAHEGADSRGVAVVAVGPSSLGSEHVPIALPEHLYKHYG
jgi:hypothetical protein